MAWSEKAIEAVLFEFDLDIEEEVNKANAQRALDAAAAVDGDAQREALAQFMIRHSFPTGHGDTHADLLAELDAAIQRSADAPAKFDAEAILKKLKEPDAPVQQTREVQLKPGWLLDDVRKAATRLEPAVQQPQISDEVREALAEAEKALEPFAAFSYALLEWRDRFGLFQSKWPNNVPVLDRSHPTEGHVGMITRVCIFTGHFIDARIALAKLRSVQ